MPFAKGHKLSIGRPKASKNVLPIIREKILNKLYRRINELDTVKVEELLTFVRALMPKDISISVDTQVQYISNTPRPIDCILIESTKSIENSNIICNSPNNDIDKTNITSNSTNHTIDNTNTLYNDTIIEEDNV